MSQGIEYKQFVFNLTTNLYQKIFSDRIIENFYAFLTRLTCTRYGKNVMFEDLFCASEILTGNQLEGTIDKIIGENLLFHSKICKARAI